MRKFISIDFETYYDDEVSVKTLGNWAYTRHPQFYAYLVSVFDGETAWVGRPEDLDWSVLKGATLLAHNAGFDKSVAEALAETGIIPELDNEWICTANMTSFLCSERALAIAANTLLQKRRDKTIRDNMKGKHWADLTAEEQLAFCKYAEEDARDCWPLFDRYQHLWPELERRLSALTIKQSNRGVAIDVELLRTYRATVDTALWSCLKKLPWVEAGEKPTGTKAIAAECRKVGIPTPPVKDEDEEAFDEWEATYSKKFPWVKAIGQYRKVNKLKAQLDTINARLRPDGTIDFSLLYFGAHTGRWSGGGAGLNMQNLRKEPIYFLDGEMFSDVSDKEAKELLAKGAVAVDVRRLFIPRPGKKFVISDLSQIEPRCLAWVTQDDDFLKFLAAGQSPYEAHARVSMGWTGGNLKKENPALYALAKARVLALGYGCGADKFIVMAWQYAALKLSLEDSTEIVNDFRASNRRITDLWNALETGHQSSAGKGDFEVELPSGRSLRYREVKREMRLKKVRNPKPGDPLTANRFVFTSKVGWKGRLTRLETYGGKLTENLIQAIARDVFGVILLHLEENVGDVIFHVHDEAIVEVDADVTAHDVETAMALTPDWLEGCPIAAEAKEAKHYLK